MTTDPELSSEIIKMDSADEFSVIKLADGSVYSWGKNDRGQMGTGAGIGIDMIECENLPLSKEGEAAFAASNTNISLVNKMAFIVTGGKEANVLVGSEYGKSWKKYKTPIVQGQKMTGIFSIDNLSMDTAVIAGGNWSSKEKKERAMAITKDGGISWKRTENNPGYISCIQFIPKTKTLVACSTTGIYYSNDLAESWKKVTEEPYYTFRISGNGELVYFSGKNKLMIMDMATLLSQ